MLAAGSCPANTLVNPESETGASGGGDGTSLPVRGEGMRHQEVRRVAVIDHLGELGIVGLGGAVEGDEHCAHVAAALLGEDGERGDQVGSGEVPMRGATALPGGGEMVGELGR